MPCLLPRLHNQPLLLSQPPPFPLRSSLLSPSSAFQKRLYRLELACSTTTVSSVTPQPSVPSNEVSLPCSLLRPHSPRYPPSVPKTVVPFGTPGRSTSVLSSNHPFPPTRPPLRSTKSRYLQRGLSSPQQDLRSLLRLYSLPRSLAPQRRSYCLELLVVQPLSPSSVALNPPFPFRLSPPFPTLLARSQTVGLFYLGQGSWRTQRGRSSVPKITVAMLTPAFRLNRSGGQARWVAIGHVPPLFNRRLLTNFVTMQVHRHVRL